MPIPKPHADESRDKFIPRCISAISDEFDDNDQRVAVCMAAWRDKDKMAEQDVARKAISLKLAGDTGAFEAVIATLNVPDKDGDITRAGAIPAKTVLVSAYNHSSWGSTPPVGKAVLKEETNRVIAVGSFNLGMVTGRDTYEAVKFTGDLQEWSYGFKVTEADSEIVDGKQYRILKKLDPFEISPVMRGAGEGTMTLGIKGESQPYAEHAKSVLLGVKEFIDRSKSLADLRAGDGRLLSAENLAKLAEILVGMKATEEEIQKILNSVGSAPDARKVFAEYSKLQASLVMAG